MDFCDYYISEMGGRSWLGMVMNKPVLMVNCWPYWRTGGTNFYLLFKNLLNKENNSYIDTKEAIKILAPDNTVNIPRIICNKIIKPKINTALNK